jgi:L,D-peptidoglycan transpeptidase YkuD (ErfK/YbiS/YcfS/YnhG family)
MRSLHKVTAIALGLSTLIAVGTVLALRADAATAPAYDPTRLTHVGDAQQLIVVAGSSKTSTYATARVYQKGTDGNWAMKLWAMPARIGWGGWVPAASRVQNTGTTPRGTFRITTAFGLKANPGTKISYKHVEAWDYWVGDQRDPQTYNLYEPYASAQRSWRISQAERLGAYPTQYEYAAVIDFNRPAATSVRWNYTYNEYATSAPVNVTLGSAIFLHINGTGATGGCVSLRRADLITVLKWLDPAKKPRIVMAPLSELALA